MRPGNRARFSLGARLVSQVLVGRLSGGIRALRIEMRLGSFGACVWIKGTMAKLLHVYRFADQHCAKTAYSHNHHGHSARLAPKLIPLANSPELHQLVTGRIKNTNGAVRVLARGVSANQSPTRRKLMAAAVSTC
jgi:hypothetical protein